jgi:hypothetical protein
LSLGDAFPIEFRRRQIEQFLVPGAVLYLEIQFPEVTKNKFVVLVGADDPNLLNVIINSETNPYIQGRAHLNVCQVTIDCANHAFLDYDSQIACHQVLPIPKQEIVDALLNDFSRYKGRVSVDVKDGIAAAVKHAVTLSKIVQTHIVNALEAQYASDAEQNGE